MSAADVLGDDGDNLVALSHLHEDGWGAAWFGDDGLNVVRDPTSAYLASDFLPVLDKACGATGIIHLRWATQGSRCPENTHPFTHGNVAFMHNGSLPVDGELSAMIDDDLRDEVLGTTDSELYFAALLTANRNHHDPVVAFASVVRGLAGESWPCLNAMWIDADQLVVCAAAQPEHRAAQLPERYYELRWEQQGDLVSAWSYDVRGEDSERGHVLPNRHLLVVRRDQPPRVIALDDVEIPHI